MSVTTAESTASALGRRAVRGGLIAAAGTWTRFVLQFATVVIVARMLGPEQYGIAAVVLIFTTLAELLRTSGVVNAVIQRADLTPERAATVHRVSCAIGAVIAIAGAVLYAAIGGPADFAVLFAVIVWCSSLAAIPGALLVRELRTLPLVGAELAAAVLSCILALVLAHAGAGSAALVWQAAAYAVLTTAMILVASRWRPRARAALSDVRPYLSFAGHSAVTQGSRYVAQNADRILLTTTVTAAEAGLYVQANQLVALPLAQITGPLHRVVLPALSRLKDQPAAFRSYFRGTAATLSLTIFPFFAALAVTAEPLIATLFGADWTGSADLFRILVLNGAAATFVFLSSWVFVSTGRARTQSRLTLATSAVAVAAVIIGSNFGAIGIALGLATASLLSAAPAYLIARRGTGLRVRDLLTPMLPGIAIAAVVALSALAAVAAAPAAPALALAAGFGASAAAYALGVAAIPAARRRVLALISHSRPRPDGNGDRTKDSS